MAASPGDAPAGRSIGSLYSTIDTLRDLAAELFIAYENDVSVDVLVGSAASVRVLANKVEDTLIAVSNALDSLG